MITLLIVTFNPLLHIKSDACMLVNTNPWSANHMTATQCIWPLACWRQHAHIQSKHQKWKVQGLKWLWTWQCLLMPDGLDGAFRKPLIHWDLSLAQPSLGFTEKISSELWLCRGKCFADVRGQRANGQTGWRPQKSNINSKTPHVIL